jgi:hypothetical protein
MSLIPIGYANDTTPCFEANEDVSYGQLSLDSFPDPLVPNIQSTYVLKTGNPLKVGQRDQYSITVTILLDISIPSSGDKGFIRSCVGGIKYISYAGGTTINYGDGSTTAPPNPTQTFTSTIVSTLIDSTTAEITITGNCIILAENGIKLGILYAGVVGNTAQFNITNILYNFRYLGIQA